ncbi:MAG: HAMP domain-containing histidine kinase, partial [Eubacteriaceae bacterium]|nr:HAMP domain-containing histidine kinase [Eubacteriaceae bacterium]
QNRFISSVSHELKTPLTTIIGYTDLLKRRGTDNRQVTDKALDTIEEESRRLQRLVDDLLQIGKMNSYEFELVLTDVDLDSILSQVCSQMSLTGEKRGIPVLYDSRDVPLVRGDGDRLRQCFLNIIDNAVKYSNDNEPVRVTAVGMGDHVEITVRDYAEGIPSDKKDKVFEPFYRVEDDRRRIDSSGGYGLGLSIVKNIITRHGGTITIDSEEEMGTLVSVKLPARDGKEAADERKN